jgi:hypothetical protein
MKVILNFSIYSSIRILSEEMLAPFLLRESLYGAAGSLNLLGSDFFTSSFSVNTRMFSYRKTKRKHKWRSSKATCTFHV